MKKILAAALSATCIFSAVSVPLLKGPNVYAGFSMVDDAQTAVEKNKALFLKAFKEAEISSDFTQDDLENMLFESCEYSAANKRERALWLKSSSSSPLRRQNRVQ